MEPTDTIIRSIEPEMDPGQHSPAPSQPEPAAAVVDGLVAWLVDVALGSAAPD